MNKNIVLIGYMACGKTSVSKRLGEILHIKPLEMDEIIAEKSNMSINDIFSKHGEGYFRDVESAVLKEVLSEEGNIISCGGGAVLRQENIDLMRKRGFVVLLTAKAETVLERIGKEEERPLLKGKSLEDIENMMKLRKSNYLKAAHVEIETDNKTLDDICRNIIRDIDTGKYL